MTGEGGKPGRDDVLFCVLNWRMCKVGEPGTRRRCPGSPHRLGHLEQSPHSYLGAALELRESGLLDAYPLHQLHLGLRQAVPELGETESRTESEWLIARIGKRS
jgi:hypothetical protein